MRTSPRIQAARLAGSTPRSWPPARAPGLRGRRFLRLARRRDDAEPQAARDGDGNHHRRDRAARAPHDQPPLETARPARAGRDCIRRPRRRNRRRSFRMRVSCALEALAWAARACRARPSCPRARRPAGAGSSAASGSPCAVPTRCSAALPAPSRPSMPSPPTPSTSPPTLTPSWLATCRAMRVDERLVNREVRVVEIAVQRERRA